MIDAVGTADETMLFESFNQPIAGDDNMMQAPALGDNSNVGPRGWGTEGWWYEGEHENCPIPTVHRHSNDGQITFSGMSVIHQLIATIIQRADAVR